RSQKSRCYPSIQELKNNTIQKIEKSTLDPSDEKIMPGGTPISGVSQLLIDEHIKLKMESAEIRFYNRTAGKNVNSHHALGLSLYTHFSSPIRRYSDILVHRIMWNLLNPSTITFTLEKIKWNEEHNTYNLHEIFLMNHYKK